MNFEIIKRDYVPTNIKESYSGRPIKQYKAFVIKCSDGNLLWATMEDIKELNPKANFADVPDFTQEK